MTVVRLILNDNFSHLAQALEETLLVPHWDITEGDLG